MNDAQARMIASAIKDLADAVRSLGPQKQIFTSNSYYTATMAKSGGTGGVSLANSTIRFVNAINTNVTTASVPASDPATEGKNFALKELEEMIPDHIRFANTRYDEDINGKHFR